MKHTRPEKLTPEETFAQNVLTSMGLTTEKVAESHRDEERTCDFRAVDGTTVFWVEVKTRTGDASIRRDLETQEVVLRSRPMGYSPRMASVISRAVTQLDALARKEEGFEVLWMMMRHPAESALHLTQAIATVFGSEDVIDLGGDGQQRACYFFKESSFFKHKSLDGMVVFGADRRTTLCVNRFSSRAPSFRESAIFRFFDEEGASQGGASGVTDPDAIERAGDAYIADCQISRRNPDAVMAYVQQKYGLKQPIHITLDEHSAIALLPPAAKPRPHKTPK